MPAAKRPAKSAAKTTAKRSAAKKGARRAKGPAKRARKASAAVKALPGTEAHAIMRGTRQSPYKMRLVIDQIRGKDVNEALALLTFSKKHAAKQIQKTLKSAVANAEHLAREADTSVDVDRLYVKRDVINEGPKLKRFTPAAMGRATPIMKRTSHVEIVVAEREQRECR